MHAQQEQHKQELYDMQERHVQQMAAVQRERDQCAGQPTASAFQATKSASEYDTSLVEGKQDARAKAFNAGINPAEARGGREAVAKANRQEARAEQLESRRRATAAELEQANADEHDDDDSTGAEAADAGNALPWKAAVDSTIDEMLNRRRKPIKADN